MLTAVVRSPALRLLRHRAPRGWSRRTAAAPRAASSGAPIEGETAAGASDSGYAAAREAQAARLHRFYVDDPLPSSGGTFHLGREESRHATRALRLKPGDRLEVCDGAGGLVVAELVGVEGSGRDGGVAAVAAVGEVRRVPFAGPKWDVAVACGSLKGGRADWLVEKCSELGAASLVPLLTERSGSVGGSSSSGDKKGRGRGRDRDRDRGDFSDSGDELTGREGRWERVAAAAMKQSLRNHRLVVHPPTTTTQLCEMVRRAPVALLCAAGAPPLREVMSMADSRTGDGLEGGYSEGGGVLIVGPEGDFTSEEVETLVAAGARPVGLGPLRLRVETAAVAIMSCVSMTHPRTQPPGC
jgi:16S rRNA (uracil1498-N3)-methyltransferase